MFLPAVFWNSNGFTHVSDSGQPGDGGDRGESTFHFFTYTTFLKEICIDNTCTAIQSDSISHFHDHLNSTSANIQFMYETEKDGSLPLLDILLSHDPNGSVCSSVYRKTTHTDQYLQFSSQYPLSHKKAVVRTLLVHFWLPFCILG